jgi:2,3-bisphosphoglycerate-dependent phosphoglycerate mutase
MHLYFIRHAQSENNALWTKTGAQVGRNADPELTDLGWKQARRVAEFIANGHLRGGTAHPEKLGFGITHLYSSLMIRAICTGHKISQAVRVPLVAWEDVHEEGGIFLEDEATGERRGLSGCTHDYLSERFPGLVVPDTLAEQDGWWNHRPFEPPEDRLPRARRFLAELLERHGDRDDRVAVVSHGGFYNLLVHAILNLPEDSGLWFLMNNTAVSYFRFSENNRVLVGFMNRTDFLAPDLIT